MNDPCRSWIALSDRAAAGESLLDAERDFLLGHAEGCAACGAEARVFGALGKALDDPSLLSEPLPDIPSGPPGPLSTARARTLRTAPRKRKLAALAMAAALLAAIVGVLGFRALQRPVRVAASHAPASFPRPLVAFVTGDARVNQQRAVAGQRLAPGDVVHVAAGELCLLVPPGVTVCAGEGSALVVGSVETSERRLGLRTGHVLARLQRQRPGSSFGFDTTRGPIVATGTIFSVEASGEDVRLRVQEGTVVSGEGSNTESFVAPVAARLGASPERSSIASDGAARDARLAELSGMWTDDAACPLDVGAGAQGGSVTVDGEYLGRTPLTALLRPGSHRLSVEQPGFAPVAERLSLHGTDRVVRSYELLPIPSASIAAVEPAPRVRAATSGSAPKSEPAASAAVLLAQARALRSAGRFSDAHAAYRRLLAEHSGSAEAQAALISLGELQLAQSGDANGALRSFDGYLRSGGALSQEARYGRIRALRRLGRHAEERAAIEKFLADYPRSVQAATLRARLSERPKR
jgi:hypothetical protein